MISERRFDALIAAIYDAGTDFHYWPKVLRLMAHSFHAPAVVFDNNSQRSEEIFVVAPQVDPIHLGRYASYYHQVNPIWPRIRSSPVGAVRTDAMVLSRQEFSRTEFFNDFLLPQDHGSMLGVVAHVDHAREVSVVVARRREFERDEISRVVRSSSPAAENLHMSGLLRCNKWRNHLEGFAN